MTNKLTLTINDAVIDSAKKYARQKGKSLSAIVENYLKAVAVTENPETTLSPRVAKLLGAVQVPDDFDYKEELSKALANKYR
jgi:hypothetical protein